MSGLTTKERSNFANSLHGLIILSSGYASPSLRTEANALFILKPVQTLQRSVLQKTFHHRCLGPTQSKVRTAAATQVRDAAAPCCSQRPSPMPDPGQALRAVSQQSSGYQITQLALVVYIKINYFMFMFYFI